MYLFSSDTLFARIVNCFPFAPHLAFWQVVFAGLEYIETMNYKDVPVVLLDELKNDQEYWGKYLEGLTLFRDKKYQEAIEIWQTVLDKYPGSQETRANIEQARLRMEQ